MQGRGPCGWLRRLWKGIGVNERQKYERRCIGCDKAMVSERSKCSSCRRQVHISKGGVVDHLRPRPCAWCGQDFRPWKQSRRRPSATFCSRECKAARFWLGKSSVIPWASCLECRSWLIARKNRKRCPRSECQPPAYVPIGGVTKAVSCFRCGVVFPTVARQGRYQCGPCRIEATREERRQRKAKRKAMQSGVDREPYRRQAIFERDRWVCQLCRKRVSKTAVVPHPKAATIDHILPTANGGADCPANVQLAHFECNWRKADKGEPQQLRLIGA